MKNWILLFTIILIASPANYSSRQKQEIKNISRQEKQVQADKSQNQIDFPVNQKGKTELARENFVRDWIIVFFIFVSGLGLAIYIRFREKSKLINKITEQKKEVDKLNLNLQEKNQQYLELVSTRDRFFSIIAHDLKSPFNSILGFSEIISEEIEELKKEEIVEYAGSIRSSAKSTLLLLQNLLDWSRTQTGKLQIEKSNFRFTEAVEENIRLHKLAAEKKGIELINKVDRDVIVYADSSMISAVVRNLISNAIKFTSAGQVIIDCEIKKEFVEITVSDTGVGIAADNIKRLFKIDTVHSTPGTEFEHGTGLGLILCKEFIEKNGGSIKVVSTVGLGSKFIFTVETAKSY